MTKIPALTASALALALVAAGCGSSNDNSGGSSNTKTQKQQPAPAAPKKKGGKSASVSMKNIQFSPRAVTVAKGTTVTWTNTDSVAHDVTKKSGPGPQFSSGTGNINKGGTYKQTFNTAGTVAYVCTVHPGMAGTIKVK
jgi:plastocyanin